MCNAEKQCGGFFFFPIQNIYSNESKIFLSGFSTWIFLFVRERLSKNLKYDDLSMHSVPLQNISLSDQGNKCLKVFFIFGGHCRGI